MKFPRFPLSAGAHVPAPAPGAAGEAGIPAAPCIRTPETRPAPAARATVRRLDEVADARIAAARRADEGAAQRPAPVKRFGESVDVRNRGALRINRFAGQQAVSEEAPAVVRLWMAQGCHELSPHEARALAAQLLDAAAHADRQNGN